MATTAAVLDILVKANTRSATGSLKNTNSQLQKVDKQTKRTEGRMTAMSRAGNRSFSLLATGAKAGGLAIGAGLVVGLKKANDEAREAAKVSRLTDAALRSTGGAANVSKKQIESLAQAISQKAGVDDEAVQSSQNLLLTFTKIRNETGKGNKIFTQASHTVADFSARFGKDLNSSAILVGKALNDPIKGVSALTRVGVQFTEQQKSQIAEMVKSGDMLGAQKVILGELGTQTRGAAAASADGMDKFKVSIDNVFEALGGPLTSALDRAGTAAAGFLDGLQTGKGAGGEFRTFITQLKNEITNWVAQNKATIQNFGQAVSNVWNAVKAVTRAVWPGIKQMVQGSLNVIMGAVRVFSGLLTGNFRQVWNGLKQIVAGSLQKVVGLIRVSPLGQAAKFVFDKVKKPASDAFNAIKRVVTTVFNGIKKIMGDVIAGILRRFADLFDIAGKIPGIGSKFRGLADRARDAATKIDKVGESVRNVPAKKDVRVNVGVKWPPVLKKAFPAFGGGGKGDGWPLDQAIGAVAQKGAQATVNKLRPEDISGGVIGGMSPFGPLGTAKGSLGKYEAIGHRMGLKTTSGYRQGDPGWHGRNRARDLSNSTGPTPQMMAYAKYMAKNFGGKLLELIYTPLGFSIKNGKKVPPYAQKDHFDHVHVAAQRGSMVPGTGSGDKVRALLEPGEGIINKKAVTAMGGAGTIHAINSAVPRFQGGGIAGIPGIFARQVRRAGLRGRKAAVIFEAMLRANAVEAGGIGNNPNRGDRDSLGVFQIRGMHGPANKRRDPTWSANWFIKAAKGLYRKGISSPHLAAMVENPQENLRYKYGSSKFVPEGRVRSLVSAFQGGPAGRPGRRRVRPPVKPTKGRSKLSYEERVQLADLDITAAERTSNLKPIGRMDDIRATRNKMRLLRGRNKKIGIRLRKINAALKGKLKPATRKRLLEERSQLLGERGSIATELGTLGGNLRTLKTGEAATPTESTGDETNPLEEAMRAQTEALQAHTQAINDQAEQARNIVAELAKQTAQGNSVTSIGLREAQRALADMIAGQLGGMTSQRLQTAGDGSTLARY